MTKHADMDVYLPDNETIILDADGDGMSPRFETRVDLRILARIILCPDTLREFNDEFAVALAREMICIKADKIKEWFLTLGLTLFRLIDAPARFDELADCRMTEFMDGVFKRGRAMELRSHRAKLMVAA